MTQKVVKGRGFKLGMSHLAIGKLCLSGTPVSNQEKIRQRKDRDGLRLSCAVPKV